MTTTESNSSVRGISDTARWVAYFRARESERPDALFRDPYAERLAGERGFGIANTLTDGNKHEWAWVARTYLFDKYISQAILNGADLVLNLAAGLDARPYRMDLPASLHWIEVDLPDIVAHKNEILANETPRCHFERIAMDLSDLPARRKLFAEVNQKFKKIVVATEGLLIYFTAEDVAAFAQDLFAGSNFQNWIIDLTSPGQLKLMQRTSGTQLSQAGAAFKFGPKEGPNFFQPYGWQSVDVQGLLQTAAKFHRSPKELRPVVLDPNHIPANFPWTGVILLTRTA